MARSVLAILILAAMLAWAHTGPHPGAQSDGAQTEQDASIIAVDVMVDSPTPIAAYQIEVTGGSNVSLVGVEGGEHQAYAEPPYYDPALLHAEANIERIVIADYTLADNLPSGEVRIARLHLMVQGAMPELGVKLVVAAGADEQAIDGATVRVVAIETRVENK